MCYILCTNKTVKKSRLWIGKEVERMFSTADHKSLDRKHGTATVVLSYQVYYFVHNVNKFCNLWRLCLETCLNTNQKLWHMIRRINANLQEAAAEEYQHISIQRECAVLWYLWTQNVTSHKGKKPHEFIVRCFCDVSSVLRCVKWHRFKYIRVRCSPT